MSESPTHRRLGSNYFVGMGFVRNEPIFLDKKEFILFEIECPEEYRGERTSLVKDVKHFKGNYTYLKSVLKKGVAVHVEGVLKQDPPRGDDAVKEFCYARKILLPG